MPGPNFYEGLTLQEALVRFAEHHGDPDTRHISQYEHELLLRVARILAPSVSTDA